MLTIVAGIWSRLSGYLTTIGMALAVLTGAFLYGRSDGKAEAKAEQDRNNAKAVKKARAVEDEVQNMGGADVDRALDKWMRDGER